MHNPVAHLEDFQLVQRCLDGLPSAIREIQLMHRDSIAGFLVNKGALPHEAEEIVTQLWADCLMASDGEIPRIARYDGSCKLRTWLKTVALNRLLTLKRRQQRVQMESLDATVSNSEDSPRWESVLSDGSPIPPDPPLVELLSSGIEAGFRACTAEQFVILQLAYGDGLKQSELARMWECNPATISRRLEEARSIVQKAALDHVRQQDGWLDLSWDDFMELARTASLGALGFD